MDKPIILYQITKMKQNQWTFKVHINYIRVRVFNPKPTKNFIKTLICLKGLHKRLIYFRNQHTPQLTNHQKNNNHTHTYHYKKTWVIATKNSDQPNSVSNQLRLSDGKMTKFPTLIHLRNTDGLVTKINVVGNLSQLNNR